MIIFEYFEILSLLPVVFLIPLLVSYVTQKKFGNIDPRKLAYGSTSLGVFLTFVGIWHGLIGFDVLNTEESIPILLEGLKVAFGSSICGLGSSLFINLFFVSSKEPDERSLDNIEDLLVDLNTSFENFSINLAEANIDALNTSIENMVASLEMGINTETHETIAKFKDSIDMLQAWQKKYVKEIEVVTEAMDKNAIVTKETSVQLDKANTVLKELKPVTETIAASIGWVQTALPSFRPKINKSEKK